MCEKCFPLIGFLFLYQTGDQHVVGIKHVENNARPSIVEFVETDNNIKLSIKSYNGINSTVTLYYNI